jgi:hypothetical protein
LLLAFDEFPLCAPVARTREPNIQHPIAPHLGPVSISRFIGLTPLLQGRRFQLLAKRESKRSHFWSGEGQKIRALKA